MTITTALQSPPAGSIRATLPEQVRAEIALAAQRVDELRALGRTFHFERDPHSGRVRAELRRLDSGTSSPVPLSVVLEVLSGEGLPA